MSYQPLINFYVYQVVLTKQLKSNFKLNIIEIPDFLQDGMMVNSGIRIGKQPRPQTNSS